TGALPRPRYEAGDFLTARDLLTEQRYRLLRMRRHDRYLHDRGIVCGLWVAPVNDPHRPWAAQVCPGYAISCCGDEIIVPAPVVVDVRDYLWTRPLIDGKPAPVAYIGIRYAEEEVRPIPTIISSCGCDDPLYQPSRIRDGFLVDVLWALPGDVSVEP